jgi:hypothetical protein
LPDGPVPKLTGPENGLPEERTDADCEIAGVIDDKIPF